jgi:hypothetical protein
MAKKEVFISEVKEGKLQKNVSILISNFLKLFEGTRIKITIEKLYKQRSLRQNGYYWGVIILYFQQGVSEQWGEFKDSKECHQELKKECNWKEVVNIKTGQIHKSIQSTRYLTTVEFEEYEERCRRLIFDYFGLTVPLPNEQLTID